MQISISKSTASLYRELLEKKKHDLKLRISELVREQKTLNEELAEVDKSLKEVSALLKGEPAHPSVITVPPEPPHYPVKEELERKAVSRVRKRKRPNAPLRTGMQDLIFNTVKMSDKPLSVSEIAAEMCRVLNIKDVSEMTNLERSVSAAVSYLTSKGDSKGRFLDRTKDEGVFVYTLK